MEYLKPFPFIPDRFVGGDDPATTIRVLAARYSALEVGSQINQVQLSRCLNFLGAAIVGHGGELRLSKVAVEIVAIPKWGERAAEDLFGSPIAVNLLYEWAFQQTLVQWIKPGTSEVEPWTVKSEGKYWRGVFPHGLKLDLFLANEINWGVIFAIRTGSAEFSKGLVTHARFKTPYTVEGGYLRSSNEIVPCLEEADLLKRLGLEYVKPEQRIGRGAVVTASVTAGGPT
jgi:DNA polymerase/3'-5' exonuclease PolX